MESPKKSLEESLKEAAYTVVGLGAVAYKASEPYLRKAEQTIEDLATKGREATENWREARNAPASNEEHQPKSDPS